MSVVSVLKFVEEDILKALLGVIANFVIIFEESDGVKDHVVVVKKAFGVEMSLILLHNISEAEELLVGDVVAENKFALLVFLKEFIAPFAWKFAAWFFALLFGKESFGEFAVVDIGDRFNLAEDSLFCVWAVDE